VERREPWFSQFGGTGRHRLIVAEQNRVVIGYAGTTRFRPKAAYETTVEMTIYCAPDAVGNAIGRRLYAHLFEMLKGEDIHRFIAVYALPNAASEALHRHFEFRVVGVYRCVQREWAEVWGCFERTAIADCR